MKNCYEYVPVIALENTTLIKSDILNPVVNIFFGKTVYFVRKDVIIFFRWPQYSQNGFAVW